MNTTEFQQLFSNARTDRYLAACGNDATRAQALYLANLGLVGAFHPLLACFEVALRNRLNAVLAAHFADPNWLLTQQTGFMADPSLVFRNQRTGQVIRNGFLLQELTGATRKVQAAGLAVTNDRLVASQTLAFWVDLFSLKHFGLLRGQPMKAFRGLPPGFGRTEALRMLTDIRLFRNRISHQEPICFLGDAISASEPTRIHQNLLRVAGWLSPVLPPFIAGLGGVAQRMSALLAV